MKKVFIIIAVFGMFTAFCQVNDIQGHIQNTGMSILYAGIPQEIIPFGGKNCENIRIAGMQKNEEGKYIVTPEFSQVGSYLTLSVEEKDKKGNYKVVHSTNYLVKSTPKPELFWGGISDGGLISVFPSKLEVKFGNNVLLGPSFGNFIVESYSIAVSGLSGTLEGTGSEISELHLAALKAMAKGSKVSISIRYSGTSKGRVTAMFDL